MTEVNVSSRHPYEVEPDTQSLLAFNRQEFFENAMQWGHTPLKNLLEQTTVCDMHVQRIYNNAPQGIDSHLVDYMARVYFGRFHVRQARNYASYEQRLNRTPYHELESGVRLRRDRAMIGAGSLQDGLLMQRDLQMPSNEIARHTHAYEDNIKERTAIRDQITEYCFEMDADTEVPMTSPELKVQGSDIISMPSDNREGIPARQVRALCVTLKDEVAYMPQEGTKVVERQTYIVDLALLDDTYPQVVATIRALDIEKLGPAAWAEQATELLGGIDLNQAFRNDDARAAFLDLSTAYYTVNESRLASIRQEHELHKKNVKESEDSTLNTIRRLMQEDEADQKSLRDSRHNYS